MSQKIGVLNREKNAPLANDYAAGLNTQVKGQLAKVIFTDKIQDRK